MYRRFEYILLDAVEETVLESQIFARDINFTDWVNDNSFREQCLPSHMILISQISQVS